VLLSVFSEVMLPLALLAAVGAFVGRSARLPVAPLSVLVYHLFSPALVFDTLVGADIDGDLVPRVVAVIVAVSVGCAALGVLYALLRGQERAEAAATVLCLAVINTGNLGLPVSRLAFGEAGLAVAVVAFVAGSMITNSFGIVIASMSDGRRLRAALLAPLKVPPLWAAAAAIVVRETGVAPGPWLAESVAMLAAAAIPLMLVVLGMQASAQRPTNGELLDILTPVGLRLIGGPLLAWGVSLLVGLSGVAQATMVVLGGMPTAVIATIIATRFDARPELVARTVGASTVLSLVTLTVLLTIVR
jgi:malate permease and related proteins